VKRFTVFGNRRSMRLLQRREGLYDPRYPEYTLRIHGLPFRPRQLLVDGRLTMLPVQKRPGPVTVKAPAGFSRLELR
jgi:alpha-glucosidase